MARVSKVGRNDPCPCGSGKKYKQCCERTTHVLSPTTWLAIVGFAVAALTALILSFTTTATRIDARCPPGQTWDSGHNGSPQPHCH